MPPIRAADHSCTPTLDNRYKLAAPTTKAAEPAPAPATEYVCYEPKGVGFLGLIKPFFNEPVCVPVPKAEPKPAPSQGSQHHWRPDLMCDPWDREFRPFNFRLSCHLEP